MYCPRCGEQMTDREGRLMCERGQMELSPRMAQMLKECFVTRECPSSKVPLTYEVGGTWFCPGCSIRMIESDGVVTCSQCGESLNEFIFDLVEFHPHLAAQRG